MKFWDLITSANANLSRNKVRTALTIIAVFIGAFTITLTAGVNAGVNDYINRQLGNLGGNNILEVMAKQKSVNTSDGPAAYDPEATIGSGSLNISLLTDTDIAKLKNVANVQTVTPAVSASPAYMQGPNGKKYVASTAQMVEGLNVDVSTGVAPDRTASDYQITLQYNYAKYFGFKSDSDAIGKTLTIAAKTPLGQVETVTAKVVGVMNNSIISNRGSLVNDSLNNAIYNITTEGMSDKLKHQYLAVVVAMKDTSADKIQQTKDDVKALGYTAQTVQDTLGTISTIINAVTIALIGFGVIALVAAIFGVVNTLYMAVSERTREIGLMKSMGMSRRKVFTLFSFEAVAIGFWGSALGAVVAIVVGQLVNRVAATTFLKDLTGFTLMQFPVIYIVVIMVVIMLITFLAGTLPARRAAKQNPIDALRYE